MDELLNPITFSKVTSLRYHSILASADMSAFISRTISKNIILKLNTKNR